MGSNVDPNPQGVYRQAWLGAASPETRSGAHAEGRFCATPGAPSDSVMSAKGCEELVADLLAASTHLGAETAVLVASSVQLALLGAGQAGDRTGFHARGG